MPTERSPEIVPDRNSLPLELMFLVGSPVNFLNILYQAQRRGLHYKALVSHHLIFYFVEVLDSSGTSRLGT